MLVGGKEKIFVLHVIISIMVWISAIAYHCNYCSCFQHSAHTEHSPVQCKLLSAVVTMWGMVEPHSCQRSCYQLACSASEWHLNNGKQLVCVCVSKCLFSMCCGFSHFHGFFVLTSLYCSVHVFICSHAM